LRLIMSVVTLLGLMTLTAAALSAPLSTSCRVLSLSGGGSYGAFEVGVLSRLIEEHPDLDYDYILGVSAGALNTGMLSTAARGAAGFAATVDELKNLWFNTKNGDVWELRRDPLKGDPSLLSTEPLKRTIEQNIGGKAVLRNVTIGTTNLATGANARHDESELRGSTNLTTILLASAAIPVAFPPVVLDGARHVDGGNSANVLTIHGIDRCDAAVDPSAPPPEIALDIILADRPLEQVPPEETLEWSLLQLAEREFAIAKGGLFNHELRFACDPGVKSRITATVYSSLDSLKVSKLGCLDFDHGDEIWGAGYNTSRVDVNKFYFCL